MAISLVTVGQKITAYIQNLIIAQVNRQGLTQIIPTSVAGTGVTLATNGKVSFATATSVSINGCFTSEFENYRVVVDISTTSTSNGGGFRLRASGTDNSASYLGRQSYGTGSSWATAAYSTSSFPYAAISATEHFLVFDINAPALARPTRVQLVGSAFAGTTATADTFINGKHNVSTAYDGFTLVPSTGNITGSLVVYGYNAAA